MLVYLGGLLICLFGFASAYSGYTKISCTTSCIKLQAKKESELPEDRRVLTRMLEMGEIIRGATDTFVKTEYGYIIATLVIVSLGTFLFIDIRSGFTIILGALMSTGGCLISLRAATMANVVTAYVARKTKSTRVTGAFALLGGKVSGLSIAACGLFGICLISLIFPSVSLETLGHGLLPVATCSAFSQMFVSYSTGCSLVALYNRLSGGIFTKGADVGADIVGKVIIGVDEDDPRNPLSVADQAGDNVGDVAGNGSDLCESYVGAIVSLAIAGLGFSATNIQLFSILKFAIIIASSGLLSSIIAIFVALFEDREIIKEVMQNPDVKVQPDSSPESLKFLDQVMYISAFCTIAATFGGAYFMFKDNPLETFKIGWVSPVVAPVVGIIGGILITVATEKYTSLTSRPVKEAAENTKHSFAFAQTIVDAFGFGSVLPPCIIMGISVYIADLLCGQIGIAGTAIGMLSFISAPVSIDTFGPISDNAGGIVEYCIRDKKDLEATRRVTDVNDAEGNTRAAVAKGFAIGSAASVVVSFNFSYMKSCRNYLTLPRTDTFNFDNSSYFVGEVFGVGFVCFFIFLLLWKTIKLAWFMAKEGLRQLSIGAPEIINEKGEKSLDYAKSDIFTNKMKPDIQTCISIATKESIKNMISPTAIAILTPIVVGFTLGPLVNGGLLYGATLTAIFGALFMGNSGGMADNAKKFIEAGMLKGFLKGSTAHKTAVELDTVGDPRKDVVGPNLDILIKLASTISLTMVPLFCKYSLAVLLHWI